MCECSQSPPKTVSKLTFDSKTTQNEIERPQIFGYPQTCLNAGFAGPLRLRSTDVEHQKAGINHLSDWIRFLISFFKSFLTHYQPSLYNQYIQSYPHLKFKILLVSFPQVYHLILVLSDDFFVNFSK